MHRQNSTAAISSLPTITGTSSNRKWIVDRHPGRRVCRALVVLVLVAAELSSTPVGDAGGRRRQQRSHGYAGEHIHVGSMLDGDCPVRPPCYCTDSVTTTQKAAGDRSARWGGDRRRDDAVVVVAQRIACDGFPDVRRPRRKWSSSRSRSSSRPRSERRRFPRFVESNDVAVERHVMLSYSGLTSIPGAAFHAIKVRLHHTAQTSYVIVHCSHVVSHGRLSR